MCSNTRNSTQHLHVTAKKLAYNTSIEAIISNVICANNTQTYKLCEPLQKQIKKSIIRLLFALTGSEV